jgi:hypothetical protein
VPEYGATIAIFPIDEMTLDYLRLTGRERSQVALVEAYAKAQGMFRARRSRSVYTERSSSICDASSRASRAAAAAGSRVAEAGEERLPGGAAVDDGRRRRKAPRRPVVARRRPTGGAPSRSPTRPPSPRARSRRRRDRRDHELHQHVESERDDRRRLLAKKAVERGLTRSRG